MRRFFPLIATLAFACGGSQPPAEGAEDTKREAGEPGESGDASADTESEAAEESGAAAPGGIPTECARKDPCVPPRAFVSKLCSDSYPGLALYLFSNSSPWGRAYLRGKTRGWNASGGASDNSSWLDFDEEVLLLAVRKADLGGMQVSGAGTGYDALRWDGSCVTLSGEEVTLDKPPSPKTAKVEWRYLDDNVQEALRADAAVNEAYLARRKECKGASSGEVSLKCVKADQKLSDAIVSYLRGGGPLPKPTKLP